MSFIGQGLEQDNNSVAVKKTFQTFFFSDLITSIECIETMILCLKYSEFLSYCKRTCS